MVFNVFFMLMILQVAPASFPATRTGNKACDEVFTIYFKFIRHSLYLPFFFFQPSNVTLHKKFYSHPPLLPGEQIVSQQDHVTCVDTFSDVAIGILHITTYRIIFAGTYAQVHEYVCMK